MRNAARAALAIVVTASGASANDCPRFGLEPGYLTEFFCTALTDLQPPRTRAVGDRTGQGAEVPADGTVAPEWLDLPLVDEAWRSDPAKTLLLIERIRAAGGRPLK